VPHRRRALLHPDKCAPLACTGEPHRGRRGIPVAMPASGGLGTAAQRLGR
jgi:hypothetical protein